ncbi:MAG: response regulator [Clostridiales bacterium]|nr:response regulator [Clostridiales bacterium]
MNTLKECTILVVDDTRINVDILVNILGDDYEVSVAMDGQEALDTIENARPDLILLDIMMPIMDGYTVIEKLKENAITEDIPVIFISALSDISNKTMGFKLGAVDYIVKPFNIEEVRARVKTHLMLSLAQKALQNQNEILEIKVEERTRELMLTQQATIMSFASLAEYRDLETGGHIKRIKEYVHIIAKELMNNPKYQNMINDKYIDFLVQSSPLHDIGKVGVPDAILKKSGKLDTDEFEIMKKHTTYGKNAIETVEKDLGELAFLHLAKEMAYTHHERWDGLGYPRGIKGNEIPLSGRIITVADVYDGLVSRRIYKPPYTHQVAVEMILKGKSMQFDPDVVDAFVGCLEEIRHIAIEQADSVEEREVLMNAYNDSHNDSLEIPSSYERYNDTFVSKNRSSHEIK